MDLNNLVWRLAQLRAPKVRQVQGPSPNNSYCPLPSGVRDDCPPGGLDAWKPGACSLGLNKLFNPSGYVFVFSCLESTKEFQFLEFFAGFGNLHSELKALGFLSLRFDIKDHEDEPGRSNYMDLTSTSGFSWRPWL